MLDRMNKTNKVLQSKCEHPCCHESPSLFPEDRVFIETNLVNMNSKPGVCVQIQITMMGKKWEQK